MKWLIGHRRFLLLLRIVVGGLFIYAGALKIRDPDRFASAVETFQLLPVAAIIVVAAVLPVFEVLLGGLLIAGWQGRAAALGLFLLSTLFALALAQALVRGLVVDCGCFGSGESSPWRTAWALGRDLILMLATAHLYRRSAS